ncbi:MAG: hypothetical protein A3E78_00405 [Alphaproteobacteria bacterium RIFCSPHIGHO2_12_FULL_63_12]|nr:MAG: hypothetical protein A3E78_00405 [Alphaproteobacteria bacterium RIFCSPHIGHO2_12_FULL_63_12]
MRAGSLIVLCAIFCATFVGRAAVLAATIAGGEDTEKGVSQKRQSAQCIDGALADSIKKEIDWIQSQKADLADRKSTLEVLGRQVEKRTMQLEELNKALTARLAEEDASLDKNKAEVSAIYSQMKPAAASGIIVGMDPDFAAGLLLEMNEEYASAILATLPPDRAYAITVLMAGKAAKK